MISHMKVQNCSCNDLFVTRCYIAYIMLYILAVGHHNDVVENSQDFDLY
jgi:hypothetical protein